MQRAGIENPLSGVNVDLSSSPTLNDLDADGDLDLVSGRLDGQFSYFENTGEASEPAFLERAGVLNPLDGFDVGDSSMPVLLDIDRDGSIDLIAGNEAGRFTYLENIGTAETPTFLQRTGGGNPLDNAQVTAFSAPGFVDVDRDGDFDLFSGDLSGGVSYFENLGTAIAPVFIGRTGSANPMDGRDLGDRSAPGLASIDRTGNPDLIGGTEQGQFETYRIPEPAPGLMLAFGVVWTIGLRLIGRRRTVATDGALALRTAPSCPESP